VPLLCFANFAFFAAKSSYPLSLSFILPVQGAMNRAPTRLYLLSFVLFVSFVVNSFVGCRSLFGQPAGAHVIGPNSESGRIVGVAMFAGKLAASSKATAAPLSQGRHGLPGDRTEPALNAAIDARHQAQ